MSQRKKKLNEYNFIVWTTKKLNDGNETEYLISEHGIVKKKQGMKFKQPLCVVMKRKNVRNHDAVNQKKNPNTKYYTHETW